MSTLKVNTIQNTSSVEMYLAKAWVNFNGTGTVAIRASGNVSSITDNGTGDYTVNFTNAMTDANYSILVSARNTLADFGYINAPLTDVPTASAFRIRTLSSSLVAADTTYNYVAIFR